MFAHSSMLYYVFSAVEKVRGWVAKLIRLFSDGRCRYQGGNEADTIVIVVDGCSDDEGGASTLTTTTANPSPTTTAPEVDSSTANEDAASIDNQPAADSENETDAGFSSDGETQSGQKENSLDPAAWTKLNKLANAAAAWQVRRRMPADVSELDQATLSKLTTPQLGFRFKEYPVLTMLRSRNADVCQLSLEWLSEEVFRMLTQLERRALHHVFAERPAMWSKQHCALYAERERELIAIARNDLEGKWVDNDLYPLHDNLTYPAYALEPLGWD